MSAGKRRQPSNRPIDEETVTEPLELDDGTEVFVGQEPVGPPYREGGGEWPHPATPPREPAPGADGEDDDPDR